MRYEEAFVMAAKRAEVQGRAFVTTNPASPGGFDVSDFRHLGCEDDNPEGWVSLFMVDRVGMIRQLDQVGMGGGWNTWEEGATAALRISALEGLEVTGFALVVTTDKVRPVRLFAHADFQEDDLTDPTENDRWPNYPPHVRWFTLGKEVTL